MAKPRSGSSSTTTTTARTAAEPASSPITNPVKPSEWIVGVYTLAILQPATLCNIDCQYCYIPTRYRQNLMPVQVAQAVADDLAAQTARVKMPLAAISWHCGEPLTTPPDHFEALLQPFEELRLAGKMHHVIQTNATLINDRWIDIFKRYGFGVGVSIDGPEHLNTVRVDRQGRPTFDRTMRGIQALKDAGIGFNVIAVVGPESIGHAWELCEFFDGLGVGSLGVNVEERENASMDRPLVTRAEAHAFWMEAIRYLRTTGSTMRIRELAAISAWLTVHLSGNTPRSSRQIVPMISTTGDVVMLSPELADATAPQHNNFVMGNVLHSPLSGLVAGMDAVPYIAEFAQGLANCAESCSFWDYCQGAHASNRYFEHGTFAATETAHCVNTVQTPVTALLSTVKGEPMSAQTATLQTVEDLLAGLAGPDAEAAVTDHKNWLNNDWKNSLYFEGDTATK